MRLVPCLAIALAPSLVHARVLPPPPGVIAAAHDDQIRALAVSEDGTVAVTSDRHGGTRLWPALDGTREPVVVAARAAAELAIVRDGDDVVFVDRDDAGQLELVRTSRLGVPRARVAIVMARPVAHVYATRGGFVALDDAQHVVLVHLDGHADPPLGVAKVGEHVAALAVRHDRALAVIDRGGAVVGRWLAVAPTGLALGADTARLRIDPRAVALSLDGKRIGAATRDGSSVRVVELATGKTVDEIADDSFGGMAQPVGFLDAHALIVRVGLGLELWDRYAVSPIASGDGVAVDGHVVAISGFGLQIAEDATTSHTLGYRVAGLTDMVPRGAGWIASDRTAVIELDPQLRERAEVELPLDGEAPPSDLHMIDADHAIGRTYDGKSWVALVDLVHHRAVDISSGYLVGFDPATGTAVVVDDTIRFARYDPKAGGFSELAPLELDGFGKTLYYDGLLFHPDRPAGALALVVLSSQGSTLRVAPVLAFHPGRARPFRLGDTFDVGPGTPEFGALQAAIAIAQGVAGAPPVARRGALTATLEHQRIVLHDGGAVRWTVPANGATGVAWSRAGELVAYGAGVERLDLATGAATVRQCGWEFGVWDKLAVHGGAAICDAP
ncbi:MAG TPA: hypothetical protein VLX92_33510 [Kofleriaceae bacterium]|nr:hypothetical protein [Kofleriaceae bacterium]